MREQLAALLSFTKSPRLKIQVIPDAHGEHALLDSSLTLLTLPNTTTVAYLESNYSGQLIEDPAQVMQRRRAYDLLRANALSPRDSAAMIRSSDGRLHPMRTTTGLTPLGGASPATATWTGATASRSPTASRALFPYGTARTPQALS